MPHAPLPVTIALGALLAFGGTGEIDPEDDGRVESCKSTVWSIVHLED